MQRELSCVWMRCSAACGQGLRTQRSMRMHFLLSSPSLAGGHLIQTSMQCVRDLRAEDKFKELWSSCLSTSVSTVPEKRPRTKPIHHQDYVVEETTGQRSARNEAALRRLYFSVIDQVVGEMEHRFGEKQTELALAVQAVDPNNCNFLNVAAIKPLMQLTNSPTVESEFLVAKQYVENLKKDWRLYFYR